MLIKGIAKGDKDLRHFTFDDEKDVVVKGGVYYYKVNYGKNKLEGEYAEDEIGYVECSKVIALGGRKPKLVGKEQPKAEQPIVVSEPEPKKRGRKPKIENLVPSSETLPVQVMGEGNPGTFEYLVNEIKADHIEEFQDKLNMKGSEGWELCGFDTNRYSLFGDIHIIAVFKRKRG